MTHGGDPYTKPAFSRRNRIARGLWAVACLLLFRPSPRPLHAWRSWLLRRFGAKIGEGCAIYPSARIWAPWNLECEDVVAIADGAIVYNPARVFLGSHSIVSQEAYLCGATHDYQDPTFPLLSRQILIGRYAWICARASVHCGVTVGEGAVLALGSIATRDLQPWTVYAGTPAKPVKNRKSSHGHAG